MPFADRSFDIIGSIEDISVFGAIRKCGGYWEPQIMNLMARLVKPTDVCLDIGANLGAHTLALADLTSSAGKVFSFEPSSINSTYLRENVEKSDFSNVSIQNIALGSSIEMHDFVNLTGMEGCSFLSAADPTEDVILRSWGIELNHMMEEVAVQTLDSWVDANHVHRVDFIKMDVEGSELGVIEGGIATFRKYRPTLIVELNKNTLMLYYKIEPSLVFDRIRDLYEYIYVIPDESAAPCLRVESFDQIEALLETPGHWWVDLLCMMDPL
jgi:FkbM family methyltransferase